MFELLLVTTALLLLGSVAIAYRKSGDVLHPMVFLGPLFVYGTVLDPWLVRGELDRFFFSQDDVLFVLVLDLLAVAALVVGVLHSPSAKLNALSRTKVTNLLTEHERALLLRFSLALCIWGFCSYAIGISNAGGFIAAYSQAKGGGVSSSGYISEGMNLGIVAAVMATLSRHRQGWSPNSFALLFVGLLPNLLQGTLGGRRGPLFLALATGILSWLLTRRRMPRLWIIWPALVATGLAVMFVASQRQFLYLGSEGSVSWDEFTRSLTQEHTDQGNNFIYGAAFVTTVRHANEFTWGREIAVNLLVRPIPSQLWPTKYEDVGATWVTSKYPGLGHVSPADWLAAVGWLPLEGSSAISITDVYGEFGWGTVAVFYLIGRGFAALYWRRRILGRVWQLLYLEALVLSIYLASQSFSAFYHRFLILAVPTLIIWMKFVEPRSHAIRHTVRLAPQRVRVRPGIRARKPA